MATRADMKARIALEIVRDDLDTQIAAAISTAISAYQQERFRFNEPSLVDAPTFNTVVGRTTYTSADNANIGTLYAIDLLSFTDVAGNTFSIRRDDSLDVRMEQWPNQTGQPEGFTYRGNKIELYPSPDQVYVVNIDGFMFVAEPPDDVTDGNPWMNEAERLIRCRAKYEIAVHVTRNDKMAARMSPDPEQSPPGEAYKAWRDLKRNFNRVRSAGRVRPMNL